MLVVLYIAVVAVANWITAKTVPLAVGPFLIPWGTWLIAVTFFARDAIQLRHGRQTAYTAILGGIAVSWITATAFGFTHAIVVASAAAFALSETLDTEVFTRMPGNVPARVAVSGVLGGALDTTVFVIVGLSPLWGGIIPWSSVPNAILGAFIVKAGLQLLAAAAWQWRVRAVTA